MLLYSCQLVTQQQTAKCIDSGQCLTHVLLWRKAKQQVSVQVLIQVLLLHFLNMLPDTRRVKPHAQVTRCLLQRIQQRPTAAVPRAMLFQPTC